MDPLLTAALITTGGNLFGNLYGSSSAKTTNRAAIAQADKQMAFQERMYRHRHQYEVEDLKAAGLNPILSAGAIGGGSPSGAMASLRDPGEAAAEAIRTTAKATGEFAVNKAMAKRIKAESKDIAAGTEVKKMQKIMMELDKPQKELLNMLVKSEKYWAGGKVNEMFMGMLRYIIKSVIGPGGIKGLFTQ